MVLKIGVVTVHDSNNFGSFLQAYALNHVLTQMGHEVYFIRTRSAKYIQSLFFQSLPYRREWLHLPAFIKKNYKGWKKYRQFKRDQACFRVIETEQDLPLDLLILGSDEIWNTRTPVFRNAVFYGINRKNAMAYAISIGAAEAEDMTCIPQSWLESVDPILARDTHTAEFLNQRGFQAPIVCDPTFLVDKEIFRTAHPHRVQKKIVGKPYILIYSYYLDKDAVDAIQKFAENNQLCIVSACFSFDWCDYNLDCSPLEFCDAMEGASCVFTSTFHGTIFSILNHKQFVSLPQSIKTSDLLSGFGLSSRLLPLSGFSEEMLGDIMNKPINYASVDEQICHTRKESLARLKAGIERRARHMEN